MKRNTIGLFLVFALLGCAHMRKVKNGNGFRRLLAPATRSQLHMQLIHVEGPIYVAEDFNYFRENTTIYIGKKGVAVLGATWTPQTAKLLAEKLRKITDKPITTVVNTHFHLDRSGGNAYFKKIGAKIIASRQTNEIMKRVWSHMVSNFKKDYHTNVRIPLVLPHVAFADRIGERYSLQGGKVQILYLGQSHTADDVFVYFPKEKILDGDCILKQHLGYLGDANIKQYPITLKRLKELHLPIQTIIAGHWSAIHGPELIDQDLELLKKRGESKAKAHKIYN